MSTTPLVSQDARRFLIQAFKATGCTQCGKRVPDLDWSDLHIHHKEGAVTRALFPRLGGDRLSRQGREAMIAEFLHCEVLCRDCHNKAHSNGTPTENQLPLFVGNGSWHYGAER